MSSLLDTMSSTYDENLLADAPAATREARQVRFENFAYHHTTFTRRLLQTLWFTD